MAPQASQKPHFYESLKSLCCSWAKRMRRDACFYKKTSNVEKTFGGSYPLRTISRELIKIVENNGPCISIRNSDHMILIDRQGFKFIIFSSVVQKAFECTSQTNKPSKRF